MNTSALLVMVAFGCLSLGCNASTSVRQSRAEGDSVGGVESGGKSGMAGTAGAKDGGAIAGSGTPEPGNGSADSAGSVDTAGSLSPLDISGRWGQFGFGDHVGVLLVEAPDGTLTGKGCGVGAPGISSGGMVFSAQYCGAITGKVVGDTASFSFPLTEYSPDMTFAARVTISGDRQRMAGTFTHSPYPSTFQTAWLRVRPDALWLDFVSPPQSLPIAGWYTLDLVPKASVGSEFLPGRAYSMYYSSDRSLSGDLGAFWNSEMSDPRRGSPLRAGPVSITPPSLPTELSLDFDADGFVGVTARTPSGGSYRFEAKRM